MCSCATCAPSKASAQLRLGVEGFSAVPVLPFTQWPWISLVHSPSHVRDTSPFEQSHGFPARLPLNMDVMEDATAAAAGRIGADFALAVQNRLGAAADHVVAAGVRLGRLLEARATPARVVVGDRMWLDGGPKASQMAAKLAPRWFGPFAVLEVLSGGSAVRLDFSEAPDMARFAVWLICAV